MTDVAIIGGGVIGLSTAYEVAKRGGSVTLVDKSQAGKQASWAGAGILPPTNEATAIHPLEQLRGMSSRLHEAWAQSLIAETGIDNGFRKCGGVYLARSVGEVASLIGLVDEWREFEIAIKELSRSELIAKLPPLGRLDDRQLPRKSFWVPDEWQIRNPDHLTALRAACRRLNVAFVEFADEPFEFCTKAERTANLAPATGENFSGRIRHIQIGGQKVVADQFCVCGGAWTEEILSPLQVRIPMIPVRGQMVLFKLPNALFDPVIYEGSRYIVARGDGHVLAGATIEEVGFENTTSDEAIEDLIAFAESLVPELNRGSCVNSWAGLRPATNDSFPYIGAVSSLENLLVSTGHFKAGLHLSTGSAQVIADLLEGKTPSVDLRPFAPERHSVRA